MSPNPSTLLRDHHAEILRIAAGHGALRLRLFGSTANGTAGSESDIDLLADFQPGRDLLDLIGLQQDLAALLGCGVDVVTEAGLVPGLRERVLHEAVPL
jgi:hypothetical protein